MFQIHLYFQVQNSNKMFRLEKLFKYLSGSLVLLCNQNWKFQFTCKASNFTKTAQQIVFHDIHRSVISDPSHPIY